MNIQAKSQIFMQEPDLLQKQLLENREEHNRVKTLFSSHSSWLKDMKHKVKFIFM